MKTKGKNTIDGNQVTSYRDTGNGIAFISEPPTRQKGLIVQPITPGDWYFDEETLIVTAGKSSGQPYVCDCRFGDLVHRVPNARLIASAPRLKAHAEKLAEALRDFLPLATDAKCMQSVKWTSIRDNARAALAHWEAAQH